MAIDFIPDQQESKNNIDFIPDQQTAGVGSGSWVGDIGANLSAGLGKGLVNLANAPHNLTNLVSPGLASHIPQLNITPEQINQAYGTQNPNLVGKIAQGVGQYA